MLKQKSSTSGMRVTFSFVFSRSSRPFIIDLESTNGTHVNGEAIPTSRYYELRASDGASILSFPIWLRVFTFILQ